MPVLLKPMASGSARKAFLLALLPVVTRLAVAGAEPPAKPELPVTAERFNDELDASEGLSFNGRGELFIGGNRAVWRAAPDGTLTRITDVTFHLGQAGIGERDILAADFGPQVALRDGPNVDGIVWRITPDGEKTVAVEGIGDPNFILVREDGSYLVSDDFTDHIYLVDLDGTVSLFSDAVPHPNGLALSPDGSILYVAQIFTGLAPLGFSDRLWALPLEEGRPAGPPRSVAETGEGGLDGLAMDERGRVYIADNGGGKIWRYDPESGDVSVVAEGMPHVASLVFGEGDFDHHAIYATSTFRGGGTIWKVRVGVRGAPQHRTDPWTGPGAPPAPATFTARPLASESER